MGDLRAHGLSVSLPVGWEGRIFNRGAAEVVANAGVPRSASGITRAVAHLANFPLPADVADFGGGVVDRMGPADLFVVLFEHGPESAGTALFAASGIPKLRPVDFAPTNLRRMLEGQSGAQRFFTLDGRPFALYVVLGSHLRRVRTVPLVNALLATVRAA